MQQQTQAQTHQQWKMRCMSTMTHKDTEDKRVHTHNADNDKHTHTPHTQHNTQPQQTQTTNNISTMRQQTMSANESASTNKTQMWQHKSTKQHINIYKTPKMKYNRTYTNTSANTTQHK